MPIALSGTNEARINMSSLAIMNNAKALKKSGKLNLIIGFKDILLVDSENLPRVNNSPKKKPIKAPTMNPIITPEIPKPIKAKKIAIRRLEIM
jgi:hypothetical protein